MTHIKTKLLFGPCLTYVFIHYDIPLIHEPSLSVRSKSLDLVTINKMKQALGRSRATKGSCPSSSSAQALEVESPDEEEDEGYVIESIVFHKSQRYNPEIIG